MDRIYMNRIDGQRRIHVEITASEVSDLLEDLQPDPEHYDSTRAFLAILDAAEETFSPVVAEGRRNRAARQTTVAIRDCTCQHPADEHSIYGCADDCACEWMPKRAARQTTGQADTEVVPTPEEGIEDARKVMQAILQLTLDRVSRDELNAEDMADSLAEALSDGLTELYRTAARAATAGAAPAVGQPAEAQPAEVPLTAAERQFLAFALDQAANELSLGRGFTDEDGTALARLRRMAEDARS